MDERNIEIKEESGDSVKIDNQSSFSVSKASVPEYSYGLGNEQLDAVVALRNLNLSSYQSTSQKGIANGYAGLDSNGLVPKTQLPSVADEDNILANQIFS